MASKFTKTILLIFLLTALLSTIAITAQAEEAQPATDTPSITVPRIPPGHFLYSLKLGWESLQEAVAFDATKKALLKQEHLRNRINELKYEVYLNGNKNTAKLLQKIQEKRLEIEEHIDNSDLRCNGLDDSACADKVKKVLESQTRNNIEVLNSLLNNPKMPNASKKGLMNAVNKSGMKQLKANMVQSNYKVSSSVVSMLPFRTANIYELSEKTWYSVTINRNSVTISPHRLSLADVTLYPTRSEMNEFNSIAKSINKNGLGWKEVGRLTKLWYNIKKEV